MFEFLFPHSFFGVVIWLSISAGGVLLATVFVLKKRSPLPKAQIIRHQSELFFLDPARNTKVEFPSLSDPGSLNLTVVVPAYKETERLPRMLEECVSFLEHRRKEMQFTYEIIIVDDGSGDETSKVALEYSSKYTTERVRVLTLEANRGKGGAIRLGVLSSRGRHILMADADGATKFSDLAKLENGLKDFSGDAVAVGSRAHLEDKAIAERSFFRNLLMWGFKMFVYVAGVKGLKDTQCGFKLFTRGAASKCFQNLHVERWAFDVELLYIARIYGIKVKEVAVNWQEMEGVLARASVSDLEKTGAPPAPLSARRPEYDAIHFLHQLLDEDLSGYIDVKESDEFLHDELKVKTKSKERLSTFHNDDPQITVDELWKSWSASEVHNWTTDQVVIWLVEHVELPQYSENFRRQNINGTQLPRLASNTPEILGSTLGVRDPIHKRKVSLKATDAVLFGSPKTRDPWGPYKEWIFFASLAVASCGVWVAFSQRRKYETQMQHMAADLERIKALEKDLADMQSSEGAASSSMEDDAMSLSAADRERLTELLHENHILRDALHRAEERAETSQWYPPVDLELVLQKTYAVEIQYFKGKRAIAEKQLHAAREECEKLHKKQQSVLGSFRVAHGSQLTHVDDQLMSAKTALGDLTADLHDRTSRWSRIENLTGFTIIPGTAGDVHKSREIPVARLRQVDHEDHAPAHGLLRNGPSGTLRSSHRRPPPSVGSRQMSGEMESYLNHYEDAGSHDTDFARRAPQYVMETSALWKESVAVRPVEHGSFASDTESVRLKIRAGADDLDSVDGSQRRAPEVAVNSELVHQGSYESDTNGRHSPPTGPATTDSDYERSHKKSGGQKMKKVFSNLSLAMQHKKSDH